MDLKALWSILKLLIENKSKRKRNRRKSGHNHTTRSDGSLPSWKLIILHRLLGFEELVFTDHDYVTLQEGRIETHLIKALGRILGMKIYSGAEFSCFLDVGFLNIEKKILKIHIIGRDFKKDDPEIRDILVYLGERRAHRATLTLEKISNLRPELRLPERIKKSKGVITSFDIAKAVCALNSDLDFKNFYRLLIKDDRYRVPQDSAEAKETIKAINRAGPSVWCHPVRTMKKNFDYFEDVADILVENGLSGIEVIGRDQSPEQTLRMIKYCISRDIRMYASADTHIPDNLIQYVKTMDEYGENEMFRPYMEAIYC